MQRLIGRLNSCIGSCGNITQSADLICCAYMSVNGVRYTWSSNVETEEKGRACNTGTNIGGCVGM